MPLSVFPVLKGLSWPVGKTPGWNTLVQRATSGREVRTSLMAYPLYNFSLQFDWLSSAAAIADFQTLIDFFNARAGSFDAFLFDDASDDSVTDFLFGTGDGVTTAFQLVRAAKVGGFSEPVMNLNGVPVIKKANVVQATPADYSISATGMVTFTSPPAAAAALTWTGTYYFRCRFEDDNMSFSQFMYQLWELRQLKMVGCLGIKI